MGVVARMIMKDLRRKVRTPLGVLVFLCFPILLSLVIGLAFGGEKPIPKTHLLVENLDEGPVGGVLFSILNSEEAAEYFKVEEVGAEGSSLIEEDKASALLRIPVSFSQDILEGKPTSLELIRNPAQGILSEIAEQAVGVLVEVLDTSSHVFRAPFEEIAKYTESDTLKITDESLAALVVAFFKIINGAGDYLDPLVITFESAFVEPEKDEDREGNSLSESVSNESEKDEDQEGSPSLFFTVFLIVLPGLSVYSLFLIADIGMRDILTEGTAGTLKRQLSGPITPGTLILAKALYSAVLSSISLIILACIGGLVVQNKVSLAGFLVLSLALVLAVTGAAGAIYGVTGNERRGAVVAGIVYLILAFPGGCFIPLESLPNSVRMIAPFTPFYWGTTGYRALMESGAGLSALIPNIVILGGMGIPLLVLGSLLLGHRIQQGGAV